MLALLAWAGSGLGGTPKTVGGEAMAVAIRLWSDYLRPTARLVFDRGGPTDTDRQARRVVRWLKENRPTEVSREDVRRHALGRTLDAARTDGVLDRLVRSRRAQAQCASTPRRAAGRRAAGRSTRL